MFKRILIVCVGNICRSPTAEFLFRKHLAAAGYFSVAETVVESVGLSALAGQGLDATALAVLAEHGMDGSAHMARQLDNGMLRTADLVLAMEKRHVATIHQIAPQASGKTFLLGKWQGDASIPDPYRQPREVFEQVYSQIDAAVSSWIEHLG